MTVQVVDEPTRPRIALHPPEHANQLFVAEVVTEQGRKDDIGPAVPEFNIPVVRVYPPGLPFLPLLLRDADAVLVAVDADSVDGYAPPPAPPGKHTQIVPSSAPYLTDAYTPYRSPRGANINPTYQPPHSFYSYRMPPEQGIDSIQLQHVPADIFERDIVPVQQFLFITSVRKIGFTSHNPLR
jgi:hypothetical protein